MGKRHTVKKLTTFQIVIIGFLSLILLGAVVLMLPISSREGVWTPFEDAVFTATSAVCVTGLIVRDTATYWSAFGQAIILLLIQIGGLGIVSVAAFIATVSGRKISLMERSMLQETISAHQLGGILKLTGFIFKITFCIELVGALLLLPTFCRLYGASGIWMSVFTSVSAFCNAGFDLMGARTGAFSSLTGFGESFALTVPVGLLIIVGGIGFLTWDDIVVHKFRFRRYKMQSKAILVTSLALIVIPAIALFFNDFAAYPLKERICLSLFQAVTPRTAGFNSADLNLLTGAGKAMFMILMVIGGSPGSTAGGMKTTTVAVLVANALSVFRRDKDTEMFGRRIEDDVVRTAATLLTMYLLLVLGSAIAISLLDGQPMEACLFETASAAGTVGLTLGLTPSLGTASHIILMALMFFGRVGGLTLMFAAVRNSSADSSKFPVEKINVG